jgi:hypothetical protein
MERITRALRDAGAHHHIFEQTTLHGVRDQDWPSWYSEWLITNNPELFEDISQEELTNMLVEADKQYQQLGKTSTQWYEFYTDFIFNHKKPKQNERKDSNNSNDKPVQSEL